MDKLIKALKSVEKPVLTGEQRRNLKESVMENVKRSPQQQMYLAYGGIISAIRKAVAGIRVEKSEALSMKARVMEMVENHSQRKFFWSNFFSFHKSFAGAMVAVLAFFGLFNFMSFQPKVVGAASFTSLSDFDGGVLVERDGEFIEVSKGMQLIKGDKITTTDDGVAVIQYFDDSVTRLAVDTQIVINDLGKPNEKSSSSYVEISLVDGEVWSRVVSVVEEQSAFVVEAGDTYTSAKKAAFNVSHEDDEVEVGVFNYSVEIEKNGEADKLVTGEKIIVNKDSKQSYKAKIASNEKDDDWVKTNLEDDKEYIGEVEEKILAAKLEYLGATSEEDIDYSTSSIRDNTILMLSFDDVKKAKVQLDLAEKNFIAAQVKIDAEDVTEEEKAEAVEAIESFVAVVEEYDRIVDEVKYRDAEYAEDLEVYLEDKLLLQKKGLSAVDGESPVFIAKEALSELEQLTAGSEEELVAIKKTQADEKLHVVEDAVNNGDFELAEKLVEDYKDHISETAEIVEEIGERSNDQKLVQEFVDTVSEDLEVLNAVDALAEQANEDVVDESDEFEVLEITEKVVKTVETETESAIEEEPVIEISEPVIVPVRSIESVVEEEPVVEEDSKLELDEPVEEPEPLVIEKEPIIEGPYGSIIEGDKPLDPLFRGY